jgi:hypothetical protein
VWSEISSILLFPFSRSSHFFGRYTQYSIRQHGLQICPCCFACQRCFGISELSSILGEWYFSGIWGYHPYASVQQSSRRFCCLRSPKYWVIMDSTRQKPTTVTPSSCNRTLHLTHVLSNTASSADAASAIDSLQHSILYFKYVSNQKWPFLIAGH